jgi:membrane protein required for colicin V production
MNWLDISILTVVALFAFLGFRSGLIKEVVSIVAVLGGIIGGVMFYDLAGGLFIRYDLVKNKSIASVGGFIVIMLCVYVVIQLLGLGLAKIMGALQLNWLDRVGGGAFGVVKGAIISFLIVSVLGFFFQEKEPPFKDSVLVPYLNESFSILRENIPKDFTDKIQRAKKLVHEKGIKAAIEEAERIKGVFKEEKDK